MKYHHTTTLLLISLALVLSCQKKTEGANESASASPAAAAAPAAAGLDGEALEAAYQATFGDPARSSDAFDAKYKDLVAKLGEPHATEAGNKFWYAATKNKQWCREVKTIGSAGASLGMADKSKCGM